VSRISDNCRRGGGWADGHAAIGQRGQDLLGTAGQYRISVKREERGAVSTYIHSRLRAGSQMEVAAPRGTFTPAASTTPVLLVSGGVGATPVLAMLRALAAERSPRRVWWLQAARNGVQ